MSTIIKFLKCAIEYTFFDLSKKYPVVTITYPVNPAELHIKKFL